MKIKFCFASICIFLGKDRKSQLLLLWQFATSMIQEKIKSNIKHSSTCMRSLFYLNPCKSSDYHGWCVSYKLPAGKERRTSELESKLAYKRDEDSLCIP